MENKNSSKFSKVKYQKTFLLIVGILFVVPATIFANIGTTLLLATGFHLVMGNALIGLVEGFILSKVFKLKKSKTILLLILANYCSAGLGYAFLNFQIAPLYNLYNVRVMFYVFTVVAYLLTIVIEWPFIAILFKGDVQWLPKSIKGCILVQTISYILLFGGYYRVRTTPFYKEIKIVKLSQLSLPENVIVYYIDASDGDIYGGLINGEKEKIYDINSTQSGSLFLWPNFSNPAKLDLVTGSMRKSQERTNIQNLVASQSDYSSAGSREAPNFQHFIAERSIQLADARHSHWAFSTGIGFSEGLLGRNTETGERVRINYEVPSVMWYARRATHLPDDKVIFQFGHRQICIYDVVKKEIALVASGRDPVAVIRK